MDDPAAAERVIEIRLRAVEVEVLRDLAREVGGALEGGVPERGADPVRERLFPRAYLDPTEEPAEEEWQSVVHGDLVRERTETLDLVLQALAGAPRDDNGVARVQVAARDLDTWVRAINDMRLVVATTLGIADDEDAERFERLPPDDPRSVTYAAYEFLTALQVALLGALLDDRS